MKESKTATICRWHNIYRYINSKILKDILIIKLELIDSFSFLYTNYELQETEIKKTIPFKIMTKRKKKHLGINLAKEFKNLCIEDCKTLVKETKDTNTWKGNPCSWTGLILVQCHIIQSNLRSKAISIKIQMSLSR